MGLVGFPNQMRVILGADWIGTYSMDPDDTITLTNIEGFPNRWSEDGTLTANTTTNRMTLYFDSYPGATPYTLFGSYAALTPYTDGTFIWMRMALPAQQTATTSGIGFLELPGGSNAILGWPNAIAHLPTTGAGYEFLKLWNNSDTAIDFFGNKFFNFFSSVSVPRSFFVDTNGSYNPDIFSSMSAVVPGDLQVLDGETVISDGSSTPIDFGDVEVTGTSPTKTFTVENVGEETITISGVTVPDGYTITQNLPGSLAGEASANLIVSLDTDTVGTFSGDIEITSDDADEGTYNFAITGEVTEPAVPEINVQLDGESIADGETTAIDFGTIAYQGTAPSKTFTVQNTGTGTLTISSVSVPSGYTVTSSLASSIAASSSATFTVKLSSTDVAGTFSGDITINSDDSNESAYNFAITATVLASTANVPIPTPTTSRNCGVPQKVTSSSGLSCSYPCSAPVAFKSTWVTVKGAYVAAVTVCGSPDKVNKLSD